MMRYEQIDNGTKYSRIPFVVELAACANQTIVEAYIFC